MSDNAILENKTRKRKQRAILSCNDCRRRKLKCDRELPCNRCLNGGIAASCAYEKVEDGHSGMEEPPTKQSRQASIQPAINWTTQAVEITSGNLGQQKNPQPLTSTAENLLQQKNAPSEIAGDNHTERLRNRVDYLEALVESLTNKSEKNPRSNAIVDTASDVEELSSSAGSVGLFKGRDFGTFYYGPSSLMSIIAQFPDLRPFMKQIYVTSSLARLRQDQKFSEDHSARTNKATCRVLSVPNLRSLLPDKTTVDVVIQKYFDTFEKTYRILHIPTFWNAYKNYWDAPPGLNTDMDAIVLAILACTLCTSTHDATRYDPNGSAFRSKAIVWIKACEAWLRCQSNKHRSLASLQARCLRLLGLSTTCLKTKEYYQECEAHLALMRSWGMHRDPSLLDHRCSIFEGEIRRRLWATSAEFELQAAVDKGMPSVLSSHEYDSAPPRNINDTEFSPDVKQLPASHPPFEFTDTSFLHHSAQTAPLRIKLCALANALNPCHSFQEMLGYEQQVQSALGQLPKWTEPPSLQACTLLDIQLRQFLVILHAQRALQIEQRTKPDHRYALLTSLEASATLIDRHYKLVDSGNFALCCIRSDYLRAALLICHIAYYAGKASDSLLMRAAKSVFDNEMGKAFRLQEERSMRPGRGNHQYWYMSAAASLVSITFDPSHAEQLKRQAVDRVSRLLYRILALQDDHDEHSLAKEVILGEEPIVISSTMTAATPNGPTSFGLGDSFANPTPGLDSFDLGMTASEGNQWMLDDFWFFNDFPSL